MWTGGVRVIVIDEKNRILMVRHHYPERDVWMVPGGGIEDGENANQAGIREVKEETGLDVSISRLLWHTEEVGERGQRFVNFFLAKVEGGELELGMDPEFDEAGQVLAEVKFMDEEELMSLEHVYPEWLRDEFWAQIGSGRLNYDAFRVRD